MSRYLQQVEEARQRDLSKKQFLTDVEGAVYTSLGVTTFRKWAVKIGCKHKVGSRVVNDKAVIDAALRGSDAT